MDLKQFFEGTQEKLNSIERRLNNFTGIGGHNSLGGLQGGQANQYYHLTAVEHGYISGVNAQSLLTTASPTFVDLTLSGTFVGPLTITQNADTIVLSHDGSSAYVKWSDGDLTLMTDEGMNTNTYVSILGKGIGFGVLEVYDTDDDSYITLGWKGDDQPTITIDTTPSEFNLLHNRPVDIKCWSSITSGNPKFRIYGFKAADAVKYLDIYVHTDGTPHFDAEVAPITFDDGIVCDNLTLVDSWIRRNVNNSALLIYSSITPNKGAKLEFWAAGSGNSGDIYLDFGDFTAAVDAGATLNIRVMDNGGVITAIQCDKDGHTKLWDWDDNVLREVDFGADDSGGAGFKVLRIPN